MMLTALADVARRTGYPVVEVPGWKTRGRPGGMLGVRTITCHHTANDGAKGNYPSLRVVRDGRTGLPGPLAQLGLGLDGTIYVIAAGKCNHAGASRKVDYTNSYAIGIEAEAVGVPGTRGDWPAAQMDAYARLCRALIDHYSLSSADVRGHKETCSPVKRKSDPDFDMSTHRARVRTVTPVRKPAPPKQEDDPMAGITLDQIKAAIRDAVPTTEEIAAQVITDLTTKPIAINKPSDSEIKAAKAAGKPVPVGSAAPLAWFVQNIEQDGDNTAAAILAKLGELHDALGKLAAVVEARLPAAPGE